MHIMKWHENWIESLNRNECIPKILVAHHKSSLALLFFRLLLLVLCFIWINRAQHSIGSALQFHIYNFIVLTKRNFQWKLKVNSTLLYLHWCLRRHSMRWNLVFIFISFILCDKFKIINLNANKHRTCIAQPTAFKIHNSMAINHFRIDIFLPSHRKIWCAPMQTHQYEWKWKWFGNSVVHMH